MLDTVMTSEQHIPVSPHSPVAQPGTAQKGLLRLELSLRLHHPTEERKHIIKLSFAKLLWS